MLSKLLTQFSKQGSTIRMMSDLGKKLAEEYGKDKVYDFTLGNPSIPAPDSVNEAIRQILDEEPSVLVHGYTDYKGDPAVRRKVAENLNERFGSSYGENNIYMTMGASSGLNQVFRAISNPGDEFIMFAPFFPEYKHQVRGIGCVSVIIPADTKTFQIDFEKLEEGLSPKTVGVIINSPSNPTGVILSEETLERLGNILKKYEEKYGHAIYLISDEPYRELAFDGKQVPFVPDFYRNTIITYSFSKSMSLPGERIGYIAINPEADQAGDLYAALAGAGRVTGYVNAPSLFQKVIGKCIGDVSDISIYERNRNRLYEALTEIGYETLKPEGAFYFFVKAPVPDATKFCKEFAEKYQVMLVPGDDFECAGYFRLAYCVTPETIENALPYFKKMWEDCCG